MKIFEIISEADLPPGYTTSPGGIAIPQSAATSTSTPAKEPPKPETKFKNASELLKKTKPAEYSKITKFASSQVDKFLRKYKMLTFWIPVLTWYVEMSSIKYAFDNQLLPLNPGESPGVVAQQMRTAITKNTIAQISALMLTWWAVIRSPRVLFGTLEAINPKFRIGGLKKVMITAAFSAAVYIFLSNDKVKDWISASILERLASELGVPEFFDSAAKGIGGVGAFIAPAGVYGVWSDAVEKAQETAGKVTGQEPRIAPDYTADKEVAGPELYKR